jgi:DNA-directed RNA polymerase
MQPALDALNAVQAVAWRINPFVTHVIRECKRRGVEVEGLPSDTDYPMPVLDKPWEEMNDDEKKLARVERAEMKRENRSLSTDRLRYDEDMEAAEALLSLSSSTSLTISIGAVANTH